VVGEHFSTYCENSNIPVLLFAKQLAVTRRITAELYRKRAKLCMSFGTLHEVDTDCSIKTYTLSCEYVVNKLLNALQVPVAYELKDCECVREQRTPLHPPVVVLPSSDLVAAMRNALLPDDLSDYCSTCGTSCVRMLFFNEAIIAVDGADGKLRLADVPRRICLEGRQYYTRGFICGGTSSSDGQSSERLTHYVAVSHDDGSYYLQDDLREKAIPYRRNTMENVALIVYTI